ncbi:hypothetical protein FRB95_001893 [Tulasnella sp. JGI-2019a]|nr:hypothetical protein FRB95_001893 [Tulasnella sp. JGI-2019a]
MHQKVVEANEALTQRLEAMERQEVRAMNAKFRHWCSEFQPEMPRKLESPF